MIRFLWIFIARSLYAMYLYTKHFDWMCVDIKAVNMNEIYREGSALHFCTRHKDLK
jgi:hypothetical protein